MPRVRFTGGNALLGESCKTCVSSFPLEIGANEYLGLESSTKSVEKLNTKTKIVVQKLLNILENTLF